MAKYGKIAALVAGGAIVGAGLGLLYAPQSGAETRKLIRSKAEKAQVEANRLAQRVKLGMDRVKTAVVRTRPEIKAA